MAFTGTGFNSSMRQDWSFQTEVTQALRDYNVKSDQILASDVLLQIGGTLSTESRQGRAAPSQYLIAKA
jgi:hypothetical protein